MDSIRYLVLAAILVFIAAILTIVGNDKTRKETRLENKKDNDDLKRVIGEYKKENVELIKQQIQIYRETLDQIARNEIPMPPDFVKTQEKSLANSAANLDEWAHNLGALKGMEEDRAELEYQALEARAAQLEPHLKPLIKPIIPLFSKIISAINKEKPFGGDIILKTINPNPVVIRVNSKYNKAIVDRNFFEVCLPKGRILWKIGLQPSGLTTLNASKENIKFPSISIHSTRTTEIHSVQLEQNGQYKIFPGPKFSSREIGKDFVDKTGDIDFLCKFIQSLFSEEIKFYKK